MGSQVYLLVEEDSSAGPVSLGDSFGGQISLAPVQVRSWLGPQSGVIGNVFLEPFIGVPGWNVRAGARGELSLSSIWPGGEPLPLHGDLFLGWNPLPCFSLRLFGGIAGSPAPGNVLTHPFGLRLEYFAP